MVTDRVEPTAEMLAFSERRTNEHIERVRRCLTLLAAVTDSRPHRLRVRIREAEVSRRDSMGSTRKRQPHTSSSPLTTVTALPPRNTCHRQLDADHAPQGATMPPRCPRPAARLSGEPGE
jgi:hypothetical protein